MDVQEIESTAHAISLHLALRKYQSGVNQSLQCRLDGVLGADLHFFHQKLNGRKALARLLIGMEGKPKQSMLRRGVAYPLPRRPVDGTNTHSQPPVKGSELLSCA